MHGAIIACRSMTLAAHHVHGPAGGPRHRPADRRAERLGQAGAGPLHHQAHQDDHQHRDEDRQQHGEDDDGENGCAHGSRVLARAPRRATEVVAAMVLLACSSPRPSGSGVVIRRSHAAAGMLRPWDSSWRWCCWSLGGWRSGRGSSRRCSWRCWCRPPAGGCGRTAGCSGASRRWWPSACAVVVVLPDGRLPIPPGGGRLVTPSYDGHAVQPQPIALSVPQHPGLAANGASTMHDDAWATDSYQGPGPLGKDPEVTTSWYGLEECATLAVRPGRPAGRALRRPHGPVMHVLDPETMRPVETLDLPDREEVGQAAVGGPLRRRLLLPRRRGARGRRDDRPPGADRRQPTGGRPDRRGRPRPRRGAGRRLPGRAAARLGGQHLVRHPGRAASASAGGTGDPTPLDLDGEIANSIAVDDTGVYLVTTQALVKVAFDEHRQPEVVWQTAYDHGTRAEARPAQRRQRHDADGAAQRAGGDHRQRRPADARAVLRRARRRPGLRGRGVRRRARARPTTPWSRSATRASWSRTTTATGAAGARCSAARRRRAGARGRRPGHRRVLGAAGAPTRSPRPRWPRCRWPPGWSTPTQAAPLVGRERVVPHRHRRPDRRDRVLGPHRHRHAVQQPLLRGDARAATDRRTSPRWAGWSGSATARACLPIRGGFAGLLVPWRL